LIVKVLGCRQPEDPRLFGLLHSAPRATPRKSVENQYAARATGSNRKRTAQILGINRKTLYRMAARFEVELGLQSSAEN
jgi:DNA-binding NtrC family response regulator